MHASSVCLAHSKRILKRIRGFQPVLPDALTSVPIVFPSLPVAPISPSPSGWVAPQPTAATASLPFSVSRTGSRELPVYSDVRHGGTKAYTVVRRYSGDVDVLAREISAVLGGARVDKRLGRLDVTGSHVHQVKAWLAGLGF